MPWGRKSDLSDDDEPRPGLWLRFQNAIVKPDDAAADAKAKAKADERTVEEIEAELAVANDKERAIGLVAAPLAALIAVIIITALIDHDPSARLSNGGVNAAHVSVSLYHTLLFVLGGMAVLMLVTSLLRKRLFMGIVMALYGLAVFNLHYWGFGVPFVFGGAWYLVRAYRLQQALKLATGDPGRSAAKRRDATAPRTSLPRPNKRYTPRTAPVRRSSKPKPEQQAG
jgi:hypothetical protein